MKSFLPVLLIVAVFYIVLIVPQARKRKRAQLLQRTVEPGARVMLASGMYGTIHDVEDNALIVEIAEGVRVRFAKAAVLRVLPEDSEDPYDSDQDEGYDDAETADADRHTTDHHGTGGSGADEDDSKDSDGHDGAAGPVPTP